MKTTYKYYRKQTAKAKRRRSPDNHKTEIENNESFGVYT